VLLGLLGTTTIVPSTACDPGWDGSYTAITVITAVERALEQESEGDEMTIVMRSTRISRRCRQVTIQRAAS
jgi:deoxycytidine triphosphate deaminase